MDEEQEECSRPRRDGRVPVNNRTAGEGWKSVEALDSSGRGESDECRSKDYIVFGRSFQKSCALSYKSARPALAPVSRETSRCAFDDQLCDLVCRDLLSIFLAYFYLNLKG